MELNRENWEARFKGYYKGVSLFGEPMKDHTSLGIGGPADVFTAPEDPVSFRNLMIVLKKESVPFSAVGGGTNILISDEGIDGVVVSVREFRRIDVLQESGVEVGLFVEAGVLLQKLVNFCQTNGYSGVEGLTGIPGTVGGAICGNSGSFGYEIGDVVESVVMMNSEGKLDRYDAMDLGFEYRGSRISRSDIVVNASLKLRKDDAEAVAERTGRFFSEKKGSQPIMERSAGCVFKNPDGNTAGRLIDEAGCKGMRRGGIEVSSIHANFFVNRGGGVASDFMLLMDQVASLVHKRFGVSLEPEIKVVGRKW